jgi:hypothetical protein
MSLESEVVLPNIGRCTGRSTGHQILLQSLLHSELRQNESVEVVSGSMNQHGEIFKIHLALGKHTERLRIIGGVRSLAWDGFQTDLKRSGWPKDLV